MRQTFLMGPFGIVALQGLDGLLEVHAFDVQFNSVPESIRRSRLLLTLGS